MPAVEPSTASLADIDQRIGNVRFTAKADLLSVVKPLAPGRPGKGPSGYQRLIPPPSRCHSHLSPRALANSQLREHDSECNNQIRDFAQGGKEKAARLCRDRAALSQ